MTDGRVQIIIRDVSERKSAEEHIRFQARLLDAVEQAVIATDRDGTILYWNRHASELFGWPSSDTVGKPLSTFVPVVDNDTSYADVFANISTEEVWTGEQSLTRQDGSQFWGHITRSPIDDASGVTTGMIAVVMDLSIRHWTQIALQESEARFRSAFDSATIGMAIINNDRTFQKLNPAILDLLGYEEHELIGLTGDAISHPDDLQVAIPLITQMHSGVIDSFMVEKRYIHKDGSVVWCLLSSAVVRDDHDNVMYSLSQFIDVTDRKQLEEQLSHHALHDALTGLPNRTLLTDRLEQVISVANYTGGTVAVLFLDIDNFKVVNDSLGHEAGDRLLVEVGALLRHLLRADHTVARFGGDEFVIVGQVDGVAEAIQIAEMILEHLRKPLTVDSREIVVSFSIGIALGERDELDGHDLLRHADLAMYRAKSIGKNRFELFDSGLQSTVIERLELEHDLRRAIELDELSLVYQPIIELASGRVVGLEALLRWNHHQRKMIPPDVFIPIAEESGLIVEIGKWVLHTACQQAVNWATDPGWPEDLRININLSARQFQQPDLSTMIADALIHHGIGGDRLRVEITESDVMADPDQAIARLFELKQLGVSTAIDDFGTGYSSLSVLHAFPIDILKIDRSFIAAMEQQPNSTPIVSTTISLAHNLGLLAVAEGIETAEQLTILRNLGCNLGQGYFFSRPLQVEHVAPLILGSVAPGTGRLQPPSGSHENTLLGTVAMERPTLQRKPSLHRKPS